MRNKRRQVSHIPRTLDALARLGYELHEKVERYTAVPGRPFGFKNDLFGIADIFAVNVDRHEFLLVQVCGESTLAEHRRKLGESQELRLWLAAGGAFQVWAWRKPKHRWVAKIQAAVLSGDRIEWENQEDVP